MKNKIIGRILKKTGIKNLIKTLVNKLSSTELQPLILEVYHQKTQTISPNILLQQYNDNRFFQPSIINPKKIAELNLLAFSYLPKSVDLLILF